MGIGYRIKEAREQLGLTQIELGKLVGVTGSAITNYEKETSHPKEQIIYKLMETLNVDANYLFQDVVKIKSQTNDVTLAEYELVKKYRFISQHSPDGIETVNHILNREYKIAEQISSVERHTEEIVHLAQPELEIKAAHNDHKADPSEEEKMRADLANLKRPT